MRFAAENSTFFLQVANNLTQKVCEKDRSN